MPLIQFYRRKRSISNSFATVVTFVVGLEERYSRASWIRASILGDSKNQVVIAIVVVLIERLKKVVVIVVYALWW